MICTPETKLPKHLADLEKSGYVFHTTGARFFGVAPVEANWEFCTQYAAETLAWLTKMGFEEICDLCINSNNDVKNMRRAVGAGQWVLIALVKSLQLEIDAHSRMRFRPDDQDNLQVWEAVYNRLLASEPERYADRVDTSGELSAKDSASCGTDVQELNQGSQPGHS